MHTVWSTEVRVYSFRYAVPTELQILKLIQIIKSNCFLKMDMKIIYCSGRKIKK